MIINKNSENANDELASLYEQTISDVKEGQIVKGTVVQITDKEVLIDVGYKSEGIVYKSEFSDPDELNVGDQIDVLLESKENDQGMVVLSHEKAKRFKGWQNIMENFKEGDLIKGKVSKRVRGGFMVDVGMDAFLPASLSMMQDFGGPDEIVGEKLEYKIVKINVPRKNIVLSRKELVEEKRKEEKQAILGTLNKGDVVKGIVRNITDFGAFIDIGGGITGLLHITDMSWGRVNHPSEIVKVNDEVEVKVLDFDKESVRVSLGLKQIQDNPWQDIDQKYPENSVIKGRVVNIMPYGIFVELEKGIEGLIHISEFSWSKKITHPNEKFKLGDEVDAIVLKSDQENQKLSLGIKQLEKDPWEGIEQTYQVGDRVKGNVSALTDYGAFVELDSGVEGLVHVSDLSWTKRVTHPKEIIKKGEEIDAVILNVDEQNRRIALGIKQLGEDPWDDIVKKYDPGTECDGTISNITNFGIFVMLEKDLEGLLHVSEINLAPEQRMEDLFKVGDAIRVKILHIDGVQKKIALSMKGLDGNDVGNESEKMEKDEKVEEAEDASEEQAVEEKPVETEETEVEASSDEDTAEEPKETSEESEEKKDETKE